MPRCVRNFWIDVEADGYKKSVGLGPRRKDGGMDVLLYVRDGGQVKSAVSILCRADGDSLSIHVRNETDEHAPVQVLTFRR